MDQYHIIKETLEAASEGEAKRLAITSRNTVAVACAAAAGVKILEYSRAIESGKNVVAFALAEGFFEFRPDFAAENVSTGEMLRRLRDPAWLAANPYHPMAFQFHAVETYKLLTRAIRDNSPIIEFLCGTTKVRLTARGNREYQRRLMSAANIPAADIERIIAMLEAAV